MVGQRAFRPAEDDPSRPPLWVIGCLVDSGMGDNTKLDRDLDRLMVRTNAAIPQIRRADLLALILKR